MSHSRLKQRMKERRIAYLAIVSFGLILIGISLWRFMELSNIKADEVVFTPHIVEPQTAPVSPQLIVSLVAGVLVLVGAGMLIIKITSDRKKKVVANPELVKFIYDGWAHDFNSDQVFDQLIQAGWQYDQVLSAFKAIYHLAQ